jgi:hypothetical protein
MYKVIALWIAAALPALAHSAPPSDDSPMTPFVMPSTLRVVDIGGYRRQQAVIEMRRKDGTVVHATRFAVTGCAPSEDPKVFYKAEEDGTKSTGAPLLFWGQPDDPKIVLMAQAICDLAASALPPPKLQNRFVSGDGETEYEVLPNSVRTYPFNGLKKWDGVVAVYTKGGDKVSMRIGVLGCNPGDTYRLTGRVNVDGSPVAGATTRAWASGGPTINDGIAERICAQGVKLP